MTNPNEKPGTPEELVKALAHHGVKGQKWGVRKERDLKGLTTRASRDIVNKSDSTKAYIEAVIKNKRNPPSPKEAAKNLKANHEKFVRKFSSSDSDPKKGLTPTEKKMLIGAGVGVAVVGGIGAAYYLKTHGQSVPTKYVEDVIDPVREEARRKALLASAKSGELAGKHISTSDLDELRTASRLGTWNGSGYTSTNGFMRPSFELPAGHTFYRISMETEIGYNPGTYVTHNLDDFYRYLNSGEFGYSSAKMITFKSTAPVKVPDLATVLDTVKEAIPVFDDVRIETPKDVLDVYHALSGSNWKSPQGQTLISALKAKGYGAIVDEMDAGVYGESPLMFFDTDHATKKVTSAITKELKDESVANLTEIAHRKL